MELSCYFMFIGYFLWVHWCVCVCVCVCVYAWVCVRLRVHVYALTSFLDKSI